MRKHVLSVIAILVVLPLLFPAVIFAEDYVWTDNGDGTCTITDYIGPGGNVIIPDTLDGLVVTNIGDEAFYATSTLTGVTISDNVTEIGDQSFHACTNLTNVVISNNVAKIRDMAFNYCSSLTEIHIPASVTSIGGSVFSDCSSLTEITVDPLNYNYSSLDGVLFNKTQTRIIQCPPAGKTGTYTIPDTVTFIENRTFSICSGLKTIIIPNHVNTIGYNAFYRCGGLTSIIIPDSVTRIYGDAFWNCYNLTSATIGNGLIEIPPELFRECTNLVEVKIGSNVASIGRSAFSNCIKLSSITIPDSVVSIHSSAFWSCNNLSTVIFGNSISDIGNCAFFYCYLTELYFKGDAPTIDNSFNDSVSDGIVYYLPTTSGWDETFEGMPTALWPADINLYGEVSFPYFVQLSEHWLESNCQESNNWCQQADIDMSGDVEIMDLLVLVDHWLEGSYTSSYCFDNFDDNVMGSIWELMISNPSLCWLDEGNQRLEVRASSNSDDDMALYVPTGWYLDTSLDFGIKIRYHNEIVSKQWTELLFALGNSEDIEENHLQFSVCSERDYRGQPQSYFYYDFIQDSNEIDDSYIARKTIDGWIFISYDAALDEVYFGIEGYGKSRAKVTVPGLLHGDWAGKHIAPHIGGSSDWVEILSGQAYWDDLIVDYGQIITE